MGKLSADFASDGACSTSHHDHFVVDLTDNVGVVEFYAFAFKEVFNFDVLDFVERERVVNPFADVGYGFNFQTEIEGLVGNFLFVGYFDGGDGNDTSVEEERKEN